MLTIRKSADRGTARFDLGCEITEADSELEVVWLYRDDMFGACEIRQLEGIFREVTTQVCANAECSPASLKPS